MDISQPVLESIAQNLLDIGAISFDDFLAYQQPTQVTPAVCGEPGDVSAVSQLHQACQRTFRNADCLKFEFIEHASQRNKQCILTITRPDGTRRSYTTQPIFTKKNEAKLEAAKIAIDMGALDFIAGDAMLAAIPDIDATPSDSVTVHPTASHPTSVDAIEKCCLEWRAGRVVPHWVPFSDPKMMYKQGCALRIQLSPHVVRVYIADPTFDLFLDAKEGCGKVAVSEGALDFIKHGDGQARPQSPIPSTASHTLPLTATTPWTLQAFFESLPRPFPESFETSVASEINAPGWLNTLVQNARGGKLMLSFFFTSDGPPGLHGCLLKLGRPGEYKASLVDARFPKRSDAKAAVCLQAMSEGIGGYVRTITAALDAKITRTMRSFSNNLVYPALTSELSKIEPDLHPHFEYDKERDAFGASMVVKLSTSPTPDQVRRYSVPSDYRNKADARVGVICHAAEHGAVEFVRFRGGTPANGYVSPYALHAYTPDTSRKRKQSGIVEDAELAPPAKKKRKKVKRRAEGEGSYLTPMGQFLSMHPGPSGDQMHDISGPGDMGQSQSFLADGSCDPSQPGVGSGFGSGATRPVAYNPGTSYNAQAHASSYSKTLDPRTVGSGPSYSLRPLRDAYGGGPRAVDVPHSEGGPSRHKPDDSLRGPRRPVEPVELEPGEVVSSDESEFSESSSRNEDDKMLPIKPEPASGGATAESADVPRTAQDKGKGKETSPADTSTTISREDHVAAKATPSHVRMLIDYCAQHRCGTPSFHETQRQDRHQVWIVIGHERFDLPTTYESVEEGRQRVAKQVLARLSKGSSG